MTLKEIEKKLYSASSEEKEALLSEYNKTITAITIGFFQLVEHYGGEDINMNEALIVFDEVKREVARVRDNISVSGFMKDIENRCSDKPENTFRVRGNSNLTGFEYLNRLAEQGR